MSRLNQLSFAAGVFSLLTLPQLPTIGIVYIVLLLLLSMAVRSTRKASSLRSVLTVVLCASAGFTYAVLHVQHHLDRQLPHTLEKQKLQITGRVVSQPQVSTRGIKFLFIVDEWHDASHPSMQSLPQRLQLSWYQFPPKILPGQQWRLSVKLKRPHGLANPGSFDYEKWALSQKIHAVGYVVRKESELLGMTDSKYHQWRFKLIHSLDTILSPLPKGGLILALITGARQGVTNDDYQVLTSTGTNHLMAISGLHISLIAGLFYWLTNGLWRCLPSVMLRVPAQQMAAGVAIVVAIIYSAVAGFSTPTVRACIMITSVMLAQILYRHCTLIDRLLLALTFVLLLDPLVILSMSFWLSFLAVATVVYVSQSGPENKIGQAINLHCRLSLAFMPITFLFFNQSSMVSGVSNLLAVPWVSLIILPLAFIGMIATFVSTTLAEWIFYLSSLNLQICWTILTSMGALPFSVIFLAFESAWSIVFLVIAMLLLLSPKGVPVKMISLCWFLAAMMSTIPKLDSGAVDITTLDVGQGLAMFVKTRHHHLIFDTGPSWPGAFDAGEQVLNPFLLQRHIDRIDTVVISHTDMDHVGGLAAVLARHPVDTVMSNETLNITEPTSLCLDGQSWQWDGVRFQVLSPLVDDSGSRNNRSCVLMIDNGFARVLLTGDIEKKTEKRLVSDYGDELKADVLIAPHHGSKTSSSPPFIDAVAPHSVIYPVGYLNRFRFPAKTIQARYRARSVQQYSTADSGAITVSLREAVKHINWSHFRLEQPRFWRQKPNQRSTS